MNMRAVWIVAMLLAGPIDTAISKQSCESLKSMKIVDTTIMQAQVVARGDMEITIPEPGNPKVMFALPEFCRVAGSIKPTADSDIRFEVWLPTRNWNQRFQQVGNGGLAGSIPLPSLAEPLQSGWAVAATDDGHVSENVFNADWAAGHPEKLIDYGYRAVHLTALASQAIVQTYYGEKANRSYFTGCSDGGRESLMEAQRYPQDFDGYLVGAPGTDIAGIGVSYVHIARTMQALGSDQITDAQLKAISARALQRCDALDGVKDGLIDDPRRCDFNVKEMICRGERNDSCLTAAQADAMQQLYDGPKDAKTGKSIQPGFAGTVGTEKNMTVFPIKMAADISKEFVSKLLYENLGLDLNSLDLAQATLDAQRKIAPVINPTADLRTARQAGKKIVLYNNWSDPNIPAQYSIAYLDAVKKALGNTDSFLRTFMVPGWQHCSGDLSISVDGTSADAQRDFLSALQRWVEQGVAPDQMLATQYQSDGTLGGFGAQPVAPGTPIKRTHLLCPYPQVAKYKGKGDTNDANNFQCRAQEAGGGR